MVDSFIVFDNIVVSMSDSIEGDLDVVVSMTVVLPVVVSSVDVSVVETVVFNTVIVVVVINIFVDALVITVFRPPPTALLSISIGRPTLPFDEVRSTTSSISFITISKVVLSRSDRITVTKNFGASVMRGTELFKKAVSSTISPEIVLLRGGFSDFNVVSIGIVTIVWKSSSSSRGASYLVVGFST